VKPTAIWRVSGLSATLKHAPNILVKNKAVADLLYCHIMFCRGKFADLAIIHDFLP